MDQPQRFGEFLLFRQSETNTYRTCHRAGLARGRAIEQIIRLEVFDQPDLDAAQLLANLESAAGLQEKLRDPHIATGAGIGEVEGDPYAAYAFELGTTLSAFLGAARRRSFPVPFDQALFIAERIALALAAAYQLEHNGGHVLHTFLTPDSVLLSNEGEVKVSGFEVGPGLREQLADHSFCAPYMSPKCRAGRSPLDQDDVFSLGSILFELVTGDPLPIEAVDFDDLVIQATGERAPESLRRLLEGSFAPRANRIPHVVAWQQDLGKLILDGEHNPTTFNLAFLMHTLLRDELEQGVADLKKEKRFVLPQQNENELTGEVTAEISTVRPPILDAEESAAEETTTGYDGELAALHLEVPSSVSEVQASGSGSISVNHKPFWIGFSISLVTASALLGAFLVFRGGADETPALPLAARANPASPPLEIVETLEPPETSTSIGPPIVPAPDPPIPVVASEVAEEDLSRPLNEDEVRRIVAERTGEIERTLKAEYEQQLESLRSQIMEAGRSEIVAERAPNAVDGSIDPEAAQGQVARVTEAPIEAMPTRVPSADAPVIDAPVDERPRPSAEPSTAATALEPEAPPPAPPAAAVQRPAMAVEAQPAPITQPARLEKASPKVPDPPDSAKEESTPARLLRLNPPTYPVAARRLGLSATARIKVLISTQGRVKEAKILGPKLGSGFDAAALAAVRRSHWKPATKKGAPVESWSSLTIEFQP